MTTRFPEPKHGFKDVEGFIIPDYSDPKFAQPDDSNLERLGELSILRSFEYQQGLFGQFRTFFTTKMSASVDNKCTNHCFTEKSLTSQNLFQHEKKCLFDCVEYLHRSQNADYAYVKKHRAIESRGEDIKPMFNL